jgi:hypothetical protein
MHNQTEVTNACCSREIDSSSQAVNAKKPMAKTKIKLESFRAVSKLGSLCEIWRVSCVDNTLGA